jgi:hypothetical protein
MVERITNQLSLIINKSLAYLQRKLNEMPKDVYSQIMGQLGQVKNGGLYKDSQVPF